MNDHLPECYQSEGKWGGGCICVSLRACEQRVLKDLVPNLHLAEMQGYNRALTAAREAVEHAYQRDSLAVRSQTEWGVEIALAAIDALREVGK